MSMCGNEDERVRDTVCFLVSEKLLARIQNQDLE